MQGPSQGKPTHVKGKSLSQKTHKGGKHKLMLTGILYYSWDTFHEVNLKLQQYFKFFENITRRNNYHREP